MTSRSLSGLIALACATLLAVACAGNDEDTFGVACVPGAQTACSCDNGATGVQFCQQDGYSVGTCQCAPPAPEGGAGGSGGAPQAACTLFPDCNACEGCWATCICQTSGDVKGCKQTCLVDAGGTSDAGSDAGGTCDVAQCPPATGIGAQFAQACCTGAGNCGLSISAIGGGCQEKNQPGTADPNCPTQSLMGITVQGCCRPDHTCGLQDPLLGLGCVDPTAFGQPKGPSC